MSDKHRSSVELLLAMNGTNGSTTFTDDGPDSRTMTAVGNAQISTARSVFNGSSGLFDGAGDYLTVPDSTDWEFGTADFTIEAWVYRDGASAYLPLWGQTQSFANEQNRNYFAYTTGNWNFLYSTGGTTITSVVIADADYETLDATWVHIAATRHGNNFRVFRDGALVGLASSTGTFGNTASVGYIGTMRLNSAQRYHAGNIAEFRLTRGVARYTEAFRPQQGPFSLAKRLGVAGQYSQPSINVYR